MAPQGTVYGLPDSFRTQKVLVAAQYGGANVKLQAPGAGLDLKKFPFGKYPAYESADGSQKLQDAHAIASLVAPSLMGGNAQEKAEIVQWLGLADDEFLPHVLAWTLPALSAMQYDKNQVEASKKELLRLLGILNEYLLTRTYLVGERISLADVALVLDLLPAYQHVLEPESRRPFINVSRWFTTLVNQPQFKSVLGDVGNHLCTKSAQFDTHKFKEFQDASSHQHAESHAAPAGGAHKEEHGKKDKKGKKEQAEKGDAPKKEEKKEKEKGERKRRRSLMKMALLLATLLRNPMRPRKLWRVNLRKRIRLLLWPRVLSTWTSSSASTVTKIRLPRRSHISGTISTRRTTVSGTASTSSRKN